MKFKHCDRETLYIMPPSVDDWLPKDHLARFIIEIIEQLDVSSIESTYSYDGRKAYPVRVMLGLIFYGYITGNYSSRKTEKATYESVPVRYIAANLHPDHDTIASFRKNFLNEMDSIFRQILLICVKMKVLTLKNVASDGSKILANASKHKALSYEYAEKLEEAIGQELAQLHKLAEEADNVPDDMNLPEELKRREDRLEGIRAIKKEIEERAQKKYEVSKLEYDEKMKEREKYTEETGKKKRGKEPIPPVPGPKKSDQVNLTDPESRIMPKSGGGFVQSYNSQISVDVGTHLIVGKHVTQHTNDKLEVEPMLQELKKTEIELDQEIEAAMYDAGYYGEENVHLIVNAGKTPYIPDKRDKHNKPLLSRFEHADPESIPEEADPVTRMKMMLKTKNGKKLYAKRKSTVEPVFGIIKSVMNFSRFSLRGFEAVSGEWNIVAIAWNLKRMFKLVAKERAQNAAASISIAT